MSNTAEQTDYSKYVKLCTLLVCCAVAAMMAFNLYVDPFGKIHSQDKIYQSSERQFKPLLLKLHAYDGMIMGASKAALIQTDPPYPLGNVLNAGFSAASPEEMYYFLRDQNPQVKWIAIEFDYSIFNANAFPYVRESVFAEKDFLEDRLGYLLSTDTLAYSLAALKNRSEGKSGLYATNGARRFAEALIEDQASAFDTTRSLKTLREVHYGDFRVSGDRLADLKKIKDWGDEKGIIIVAWLGPYHRNELELIRKTLPDDAKTIRTALKNTFPNFVDFSEAYPEDKYYWNRDQLHYLHTTAELFMKEHIFPRINTLLESRP